MTRVVLISQSEGLVRIHHIREVEGTVEAQLGRDVLGSVRDGLPRQTVPFGEIRALAVDAKTMQGRVVVEIAEPHVHGKGAVPMHIAPTCIEGATTTFAALRDGATTTRPPVTDGESSRDEQENPPTIKAGERNA